MELTTVCDCSTLKHLDDPHIGSIVNAYSGTGFIQELDSKNDVSTMTVESQRLTGRSFELNSRDTFVAHLVINTYGGSQQNVRKHDCLQARTLFSDYVDTSGHLLEPALRATNDPYELKGVQFSALKFSKTLNKRIVRKNRDNVRPDLPARHT